MNTFAMLCCFLQNLRQFYGGGHIPEGGGVVIGIRFPLKSKKMQKQICATSSKYNNPFLVACYAVCTLYTCSGCAPFQPVSSIILVE